MLDTVVHHLANCSCLELICWTQLAAVTLGLSPFVPIWIGDHYLAARRASQGIR
jgi:hypothetical protein